MTSLHTTLHRLAPALGSADTSGRRAAHTLCSCALHKLQVQPQCQIQYPNFSARARGGVSSDCLQPTVHGLTVEALDFPKIERFLLVVRRKIEQRNATSWRSSVIAMHGPLMGPSCVICCCFLPVVPECYKRKLKPHNETRRHKGLNRSRPLCIGCDAPSKATYGPMYTYKAWRAFPSSRTLIRTFRFGCVDAGPRRSITFNVRGRQLL